MFFNVFLKLPRLLDNWPPASGLLALNPGYQFQVLGAQVTKSAIHA